MSTSSDSHVVKLKVTLAHNKRIWRSIAIPADQTLDDLHVAIFGAFNREEDHLYAFYFPAKPTQSLRKLYDSPHYTAPMPLEEHSPDLNAATERLSGLRLKPKQKFYYLFDFGDSWWHEITVVDFAPRDPAQQYPCIIDSRGESPPQYPDGDEED